MTTNLLQNSYTVVCVGVFTFMCEVFLSMVLSNCVCVCVCVYCKYSIAQIGTEFTVLDVATCNLGTACSPILLYLPEEHPKMLQS